MSIARSKASISARVYANDAHVTYLRATCAALLSVHFAHGHRILETDARQHNFHVVTVELGSL